MSARICLFGAGGHGRVLADQIRARLPEAAICFGDARKPIGSSVNGYEVVFDTPQSVKEARIIVSIGDNALRARLQHAAVVAGVEVTSFIADCEHYFAAPPGAGSMIMAGAVVTSDAQIGAGVIVNSGAIIEHDSLLGDFCHVASGAVLSGGSILGREVFIGSGAQVIRGARIAPGCIIGAGATVIDDIPRQGLYVGTPARLIRSLPDRPEVQRKEHPS